MSNMVSFKTDNSERWTTSQNDRRLILSTCHMGYSIQEHNFMAKLPCSDFFTRESLSRVLFPLFVLITPQEYGITV